MDGEENFLQLSPPEVHIAPFPQLKQGIIGLGVRVRQKEMLYLTQLPYF
jgi:hypothetical protein